MKKTEASSSENVCVDKKFNFKNKLIGLIVVIVLIIGGYYAWTFLAPGQTEQQKQEKEIKALVAQVSKLMVLPEGELPQVAEIKDAALAAKEQPFYTGAQNGDKVLVYVNARKAIVYSPSRDMIVNAGPILGDSEATATPEPATPTGTTTKKK